MPTSPSLGVRRVTKQFEEVEQIGRDFETADDVYRALFALATDPDIDLKEFKPEVSIIGNSLVIERLDK